MVKKNTKAEPKQAEKSFYIPLDIDAAMAKFDDDYVIQKGEFCGIDQLKDNFAWMKGFVNAWYGWPNDGKGTFFDFMSVLMAKNKGWKFCLFKPEDMDTVIEKGVAEIKANRIMYNLAWTLTGKTWNKDFARRFVTPYMKMKEEMEALQFIKKHFFVIYPEDRVYKSMIDNCKMMKDKYEIDAFLWDPWNEVTLPASAGDRDDIKLINAFRDIKKFAMESNTVFNIVSHAKSMREIKEKDGSFKVCDQFMQIGGAAWDIKMDGQFSIHKPWRHKDPNDNMVHFHCLKQKQWEVVGSRKGVCESIEFDPIKKQYRFDGKYPMDGTVYTGPSMPTYQKNSSIFNKKKKDAAPPSTFEAQEPPEQNANFEKVVDPNEAPF